jgi:ribosomal protein S18 acetylase RimI-like enzyme
MSPDVAPDRIATVRAFNRIVTERVGALEETYLALGRSLGASRLLWEIGEHGADVRELRGRLGLDSGYVSRLLRALESEGLVVVAGGPDDARVHGRAIGCGGVIFEPDGTGYLKRMWVADDVRGLGVGGRLLTALEEAAREHGCVATTLETNATLTEAIAMYRAAGYAAVAPFNDEVYADHWFRKELIAQRIGTPTSPPPSGVSRDPILTSVGAGTNPPANSASP